MRLRLATSCLISLLALSGCMGSILKTAGGLEEFPSLRPELSGVPELAGMVPLAEVLSKGRQAGVISSAPLDLIKNYAEPVPLSPKDTWLIIIGKVEFVFQLVYDHKTGALRRPTATHDVDAPDSAGRASTDKPLGLAPREMLSIRYRFYRGGGSLNIDKETGTGAEASGNYVELGAPLPSGVRRTLGNTSTQRIFKGVTNVESDNTVDTEIEEINAGITIDTLVGSLPGGYFRMQSLLTVSAFTAGLNTTEFTTPLDIDAKRGEWIQCTSFNAASAGLRASLQGIGLKVNASGEMVRVFVRVD